MKPLGIRPRDQSPGDLPAKWRRAWERVLDEDFARIEDFRRDVAELAALIADSYAQIDEVRARREAGDALLARYAALCPAPTRAERRARRKALGARMPWVGKGRR